MHGFGPVSAILNHKGAHVHAISPEDTVFDAIQKMADNNIGSLLVFANDQLIGIISERDYTRKVALKGKSSKQTAVREIMLSPIVSASPDSTIEECMRLMTENRIRHLPILAGHGLAGVISIGDLVNWIISAQNATIHQMEAYISGQYSG